MLHFRVGNVARERHEEAHVEPTPRLGWRRRKAVENSAQAGRAPIAFEDREAIVPGVAAVDHDWQLRRARLLELPPEDALLHVARGLLLVIVVIEAHLAPRDHARVPCELVELREVLLGGGLRVVGVNADGRVDPIVLFGERNRGVDALGGARSAADRQQRFDARRAGALENRRAVGVEFRGFQVRV